MKYYIDTIHIPNPSMELDLNRLKHIAPSSFILGCQRRVKHFTLGGCKKKCL